MKTIRWLVTISSVVLTATLSLAATAPGTTLPATKAMSLKVLNANAWTIYTTNYGPFVNPGAGPGGFWNGPYGYIYGAGLWVGAITNAGDTIVAVGYNTTGGQAEMGPVSMDDSYENYISDPFARVYLSTDPTDYYDWPVLDQNGNRIIKSIQDSYAKYSDENPAFTFDGEKPLGILVEQFSYAWNYADNNDVVFFYFKVKNISGNALNNVYIGPATDCDIGDEGGYPNDRTAFDYTRNLAMQFQSEPEAGWPETGVVGFRYFESPINNTGATIHVVDNQFPHDILPDSALGLTAFKVFALGLDPISDQTRYQEMTGRNWWNTVLDAYDEWGAFSAEDKRFMMSSGPFNLAIDATVTTCIGAICALDTVSLKNVSDIAQTIYDNGFVVASPPASPSFALTAVAGDGKAYLSWDKAMEATPDPYWALLPDSMGWYTYFDGSWAELSSASQLLIDSFEVLTGYTFTKIARGEANPGTDTLRAHYNQKGLYQPYDFQGYLLYRADNLADLNDPEKRIPVGTMHYGSSGAYGYFYDKVDGYQIVLDINRYPYATPDTTYYLPIYDTIGTDRGLIYGLVEDSLTNGQTYYYGISANDYQPNAYFTHKCPTTMSSDPASYAQAVTPIASPDGYILPDIDIRVDGGSDIRFAGTTDYFYNSMVINPSAVQDDSFKILWGSMHKIISGTYRLPVYSGYLYNSSDVLIDSLDIIPDYGYYGTYPHQVLNGPAYDQLPFGGIALQPFYVFDPVEAVIDSFEIIESLTGTRTYPADSVKVQLNSSIFSLPYCLWQWRGSDFEIRWRDTVISATDGLTASVWDITNNVEVPLETVVTKQNMTLSSWCFNPMITAGTEYITATTAAQSSGYGLHIAGTTLYFNYGSSVLRRLSTIWNYRPETGDIWRIYCSGPRPPIESDIVTITTTKEVTGVAGSPDGFISKFFLSQNAPNPFGHSGTTISYQIGGSGSSPVSLKIYNITGQLVKTLVNDNKTPGYYNATWNGKAENGQKVSAGIYIYRLQAGDKNLTKKMVLVK